MVELWFMSHFLELKYGVNVGEELDMWMCFNMKCERNINVSNVFLACIYLVSFALQKILLIIYNKRGMK